MKRFLATTVMFLSGLASVEAADFGVPVPAPVPPAFSYNSVLSELRIGVFAHDPFSPEKGSGDINGEILFSKPFRAADPFTDFFIPRLHVGSTVNTVGRTSHIYAGFTWSYDITRSIFVEASLGGAVHNGNTGTYVPPHTNALGCSPLFRESVSVGFRLDAHWSLMGTVEHMSNAGLCNNNRGLTNMGARLGYTF